MNGIKLAAIKVERRSVSVAVFIGQRLDYTQQHQLASLFEKAQGSAVGFINWVITTLDIQSAAIEKVPPGKAIRRSLLTDAVIATLRGNGIPIWETGKLELLEAFGVPPLASRREMREVIFSIWPVLPSKDGKALVLDAVALGLYVQTERKFLS
jgi:hypothetical protein